jgi:hypothetical protein
MKSTEYGINISLRRKSIFPPVFGAAPQGGMFLIIDAVDVAVARFDLGHGSNKFVLRLLRPSRDALENPFSNLLLPYQ